MQAQKIFAGLAVVAMGSGLGLAGCGGATGEEYTMVQHASGGVAAASDWSFPESVAEPMRVCMKEHANELRTFSHVMKVEAKVPAGGGDVQEVTLRSSTLHHEGLESCLMKALTTLSIPSSVIPMRSSEPMSGGESMRDSRGPLGIAQVLAGAVAVGPVILMAAGVTLVVYVAAVATEEAIAAVRRTQKLENMCQALLVACISDKWLPPGHEYGVEKDCKVCNWRCKNEGFWPYNMCPITN